MKHFKVFNPEHDLALANGDKHFIAPKNIREMACDLAPLMEVLDYDHPLVWGWDTAITERLRRSGVSKDDLPSDCALAALRTRSERKTAHDVLYAFHSDNPNGPYTGESIIIHTTEEAASYAARHGHIILKDPLSGSGKGLRHVKGGLPLIEAAKAALLWGDKPPSVATDAHFASARRGGTSKSAKTSPEELSPSLATGLNKTMEWAEALIRRHGYLTAEPYYNKAQDFAMEFYVADNQCRFIGYSLFKTNHHGRYEGNVLMEDERIEACLSQYVPRAALHDLQAWVVRHSHRIIPEEWDTARFPLHFGIDMMIVENDSCNKAYSIHPCVEINLRLNMGIIAHEVRHRLLAPGVEGTFHVSAFPTEETLCTFCDNCRRKHPANYHNGKVLSGYHPLTPIQPHTRYHAYIICK